MLYNDIKSAHKILFHNLIISSASESEALPNQDFVSGANFHYWYYCFFVLNGAGKNLGFFKKKFVTFRCFMFVRFFSFSRFLGCKVHTVARGTLDKTNTPKKNTKIRVYPIGLRFTKEHYNIWKLQ